MYKQEVDLNELKRRLALFDKNIEKAKKLSLPEGTKCPKCEGKLESISIENKFSVEKCKKCKGIWRDYGELQGFLKIDHPTLLKFESDAPLKAREKISDDEIYYFDKNRKWMGCPRCKSSLRETYFKRDHSIWVDICDKCKGAFYDYQELSKVINLLKNAG